MIHLTRMRFADASMHCTGIGRVHVIMGKASPRTSAGRTFLSVDPKTRHTDAGRLAGGECRRRILAPVQARHAGVRISRNVRGDEKGAFRTPWDVKAEPRRDEVHQ